MDAEVELRPARRGDIDGIARVWRAAWRDAHVALVPDALVAERTEESFRARARDELADTAVAEVGGVIAGFVTVADDELDQLFVAAEHRGSGVARALLGEGERRIAVAGYRRAQLTVVVGNERARRFYERAGWVERGTFVHPAPGDVTLESHRYVRDLP